MESDKRLPNPWDLVSDEVKERLRDQARTVEAAEAEVRRISVRLDEIDRSLTASAARRYSDVRAAAARALGEETPGPGAVPAAVDRGELEQQLAGLKVRLVEAEDLYRRQKAIVRTSLLDSVRAVAQGPLAQRYLEACDVIADTFASLLAIEDLEINLLGGSADVGKVKHIAPRETWRRLYLPGSFVGELPAVAKRSREEWSLPVVLSGDVALECGVGQAALARLRASVEKAIGYWPFK